MSPIDDKSMSVEVKGLTVRFGDFTAVNNISFSVFEGEIFGFLGANGAGKTTTIRVLCGLLEPQAGEVRVAGLNLRDGFQAIKSKVGYMSQRFKLYEDLTVWENLAFTASLRKMSPERAASRAKELLDFVGFEKPLSTFVKDLSGGIKQQVSLSAALIHDPDIVFLDEPTAGVTPAARARFWSLIRSLARSGKTLFVTTHYLDEAEECNRIALMKEGEIIALDRPEELKRKTFPEPMFEITPPTSDSSELRIIHNHPAISSLQPYGMHFHVVVSDRNTWKMLCQNELRSCQVREVPPSLEDVFIRLVERGRRES